MKAIYAIFLSSILMSACGGKRDTDSASQILPEPPKSEQPEPQATQGSWPRHFTRLNSNTFFTADDGVHGRELWVTQDDDDVLLVADITVGPDSTDFVWIRTLGNRLVFLTKEAEDSFYLWALEGTELIQLQHHQFDSNATDMQDTFFLENGLIYIFWESQKQSLFITDGSPEGSIHIGQFPFYRDDFHLKNWRKNYYYSQFSRLGSTHLYFEVSESDAKEIWQTDGTLENTKQAISEEILGEDISLSDYKISADKDRLYFSATTTQTTNEESRPRVDSIFTLNNSGAINKIIQSIGALDKIHATEAGLLLKAAPLEKTNLDDRRIYFSNSADGFELHELTTIANVGYISDSYIANAKELVFSTGDQGTGSLYRLELDTLNLMELISNGDQICNTGYRIINSSFVLEAMIGTHSTCGPRDRLFSYSSGDTALTPLLTYETGAANNNHDNTLIGDHIAIDGKFYYVTNTTSPAEDSAKPTGESLHVVDNSTQIDTEILDHIYVYGEEFEENTKVPVFWATESDIYIGVDDGSAGIEPWRINGVNATLVGDINKVSAPN